MSHRTSLPSLIFAFGAVVLCVSTTSGPAQASTVPALVPDPVRAVLQNHCIRCHGAEEQSGEVRFDQLAALGKPARLALLNKMQAALHLGEMPPEDEPQPKPGARKLLTDWIRATLDAAGASELRDKMRYPEYGNYVDHDRLFSGTIRAKAFTPARRWLVSPQIFLERVQAVFKLEGRQRRRSFYGVTNPIVLPDHSGVRYYDTASLDGGHLLVMLTNADWISKKQILAARYHKINRRKIEHPNPKDRWVPPNAEPAFVTLVRKTTAPTEAEMVAAIQAQFDCVLQRPATEPEQQRYLELLRSAIALGGNAEGLRQMLKAVLLESEFLYRLEFGAGEPDDAGRRRLSPREASYAIAYALSDRIPDRQLVLAARFGKLRTKADYRREVLRILGDKVSFRGEIDPAINSKGGLVSHQATHPKINRFFREFFGYPHSIKVFKDTPRSGGFYSNAGRGSSGTAGQVTNEADRVVDHVLRQDRNVFARLLTTDKWFVYHRHSNEEGTKIVAAWRKAYDVLKETDWHKDPKQFLLDNFAKYEELLRPLRIRSIAPKAFAGRRGADKVLKLYMEYFDHTFGAGITPFTIPTWFHGNHHRYSEIYSLPGVPGFRGGYRSQDNWDYPLIQPFKIENRKGLLTHPAWLVAHSQNTATDPVRRGRWIREKLLAGRVPDVPINVDAQIPEDPKRTLRSRLDSVTKNQECWKCHRQMNPLGLPFESFDDFGRFRTEEALEHPSNLIEKGNGKTSSDVYKTAPVDTTGVLDGTGDPELDGPVKDVMDLIDRLARSTRVRQSIIRHAFRYFLGRNELLSDAPTLVDADRAYVESGGSFQAVIVSLLTSDSFVYRKDPNH